MAVYGVGKPAGTVDRTQVVGMRLYFADGSIVTARSFGAWSLAAAVELQCWNVFLADVFDAYDDKSQLVRKNYRQLFCSEDYYWFVSGNEYGAGDLARVPLGLPAGAVKTGSLLPSAEFRAIYNTAYQDQIW